MLFSIKDTIQEACAWIGAFLNLYFFILPIAPFRDLLKGKINFEDIPVTKTSIIYINCICWYTYGELVFSDQLRLSYIIGSIISLVLILIYLYYEIRKYIFDTLLNIGILTTGTYSLYVGLTLILDDDLIAGKICNISYLALSFFPGQVIYKVIKEKNYNLINLRTAKFAFYTGILWVIYGVLISEFYVVFPHALQIVWSLIQMVIYRSYKKKFPEIGEKDKDSNKDNSLGLENKEGDENIKEENSILKQEDDDKDSNVKEKPVKIIEKIN
jgi:solute carrier family 50 protein (sugar transporter)